MEESKNKKKVGRPKKSPKTPLDDLTAGKRIEGLFGAYGMEYFTRGEDGVSDFDNDFEAIENPIDRIRIQLAMAEYVAPRKKAVDSTLSGEVKATGLEEFFRRASGGKSEDE